VTAGTLVFLARQREGLTVIWGSPKCGKTFWAFDLAMHVALGWLYRGRHVAQGTVVYVACEGERGLRARKEAFRRPRLGPADKPPFYLLTTRLDLAKQIDDLIMDIAAQIPSGAVPMSVRARSRTFGGGGPKKRREQPHALQKLTENCPLRRRVRSHGSGNAIGLIQLSQNGARLPYDRRQIASPSDSFCRVMSMPERILIADGSTASGGSSMHSTAPFSAHRWRSAPTAAPRPSTATGCPVHREFLGGHQLFPQSFRYLPRPSARPRR
jgi:hypothetical protein